MFFHLMVIMINERKTEFMNEQHYVALANSPISYAFLFQKIVMIHFRIYVIFVLRCLFGK